MAIDLIQTISILTHELEPEAEVNKRYPYQSTDGDENNGAYEADLRIGDDWTDNQKYG